MRVSRITGAGTGLLVILLALWAGLIPFVGPYFGYGFAPDATWHFTLNRLWLDILPAVAAILGGVVMFLAARRSVGAAGSWLALIAGAWLLLGPSVSLFWQHPAAGSLISGIGTPLGGPNRAAVEMIGFFYGAGALIAALAAFTIGRFVPGPTLRPDPPPAAQAREPEGATVDRPPAREPAYLP